MGAWRPADENLLQRLEDETVVNALFDTLVGKGAESPEEEDRAVRLHPRAAGLIAELRKIVSGSEAVTAALGGDVERLVRFIDGLALRPLPPELLHHLALFHRKAALMLEHASPDRAATAWVRSLAAWIALAEERAYLSRLEAAVLGAEVKRTAPSTITPENVPLEIIADIAHGAEASARDLEPRGRAALIALARTEEAARLAQAPDASARRLRAEAERLRNAAIEAALSVIAEGLDEANVRGELASSGRTLLLRAIPVWTWTANDEAVEHFVIDRIDKIGWELYRARNWDALRYLLDPFRPMFERLASRIEQDPSQIAYAAGCAQMFVFLSETDSSAPGKLAMAERAVKICPTHRNGRLILASVLCTQALDAMRGMTVVTRKSEIARIEAVLTRAESLYPQASDLPEAKRMLERVRGSRLTL